MPSISFIPGTIVPASWLNDVNVAVFNTIPTLAPLIGPNFTNPNLGTATATTINRYTFTQPATAATLTIANNKTFTANASITITGTDGNTLTVGPSGGTVQGGGTNTGDQLTFKTISVPTQSDIVADQLDDTLNINAGTGISLTTNAGTDTLTITNTATSALVFLGSVNVTAVANIDFLNVFTSAYDDYLIVIDQVQPATDASFLQLRFANAGAAVSTAVYGYQEWAAGTAFAVTGQTTISLTPGTGWSNAANQTGCVYLTVQGVNDTSSKPKTTISQGVYITTTALTAQGINANGTYRNAVAASGFRLLWSAGNFAASGTVKVYGIGKV